MKKLGKIDTVTKDYMKDPVIFADMFNKFLYLGRQVIRSEVINVTTNLKLKYPEGKGKINMCVALEEMRTESEIFAVSSQQAEDKVKKYWK